MSLSEIQFEIQRRVILFRPTTTMPDGSQLGFNGDPNDITSPSTPGETLLYASPRNTRFSQIDPSTGDVEQEWFKKALPNGWVKLTSDAEFDPSGTPSPTWQLNNTAEGVVLEDENGNLVVRTHDGSLGYVTLEGIKISDLTGYLKAVDGSVYANEIGYAFDFDPNDPELVITTHPDGSITFEAPHNLGTENHLVSVYDMSYAKPKTIYPDVQINENIDEITFSSVPTEFRVVIISF